MQKENSINHKEHKDLKEIIFEGANDGRIFWGRDEEK